MSTTTPPSAGAPTGGAGPAPSGATYQPFIPAERTVPELTALPLIIGAVLGIVFAYSSVYLGLKAGLTVSASIPVAVLSITIFRWLSQRLRIRQATVLENNIAQTVGSAGESLAAGIVFTLPSLLLLGHDMELSRVLLVALLGGLIGVLMMIPMRQGLIVEEHGKLMYPEGTACADVLIVGETGGTSAKTVFLGFFAGALYAFFNLITRAWAGAATFAFDFWGRLRGAILEFEVSPPMLGVGYIIGPRVASVMMAGGALGSLILIPLIVLFGESMPEPMYPETVKRIAEMSPGELRGTYIRYIGAGAVATGGFIALARGLPTIVGAFTGGLRNLRSSGAGPRLVKKRTEQDLPMSIVLGGSLALALAIWLAPMLEINLVSAVLIVLFGFFFVTVSSRVTGEIGSSSNPISGMTVATLLITCGLFVAVGWTGTSYKAMALTTAALVCVAASNGGTISQDLKTGFLVGATPRHQQVAIGVGVVTSAIIIGFVVQALNEGNTTFKPVAFGSFAAQPEAGAKVRAGPDGKERPVLHVYEDQGDVPRGQYLVDEAGRPLYLIDPGIAGAYPYRLEAATFAGVKLDAPAGAPVELGLDHRPYRVVDVDEPRDGLRPGRYLVSEAGEITYSARPVDKFAAPQAQLFRLIIDGTLGGNLPWGLVLVGVFIAIMLELVGVASLPFAVGLYLPLATSAGIFVGGMVRKLVDSRRKDIGAAESEFSPGMLMASGLIAGGAITGVIQSGLMLAAKDEALDLSGPLGALARNEGWWPMAMYLLLAGLLAWVGIRGKMGPTVPSATK